MQGIKKSNSYLAEVDTIDLKTAFLSISENVVGKNLTLVMIDELYSQYNSLFSMCELEDLKYKIELDEQKQMIGFTPIRNIDKLAIKGILSM